MNKSIKININNQKKLSRKRRRYLLNNTDIEKYRRKKILT